MVMSILSFKATKLRKENQRTYKKAAKFRKARIRYRLILLLLKSAARFGRQMDPTDGSPLQNVFIDDARKDYRQLF